MGITPVIKNMFCEKIYLGHKWVKDMAMFQCLGHLPLTCDLDLRLEKGHHYLNAPYLISIMFEVCGSNKL